MVFDAGVWKGIDNSRPSPVRKGLSFIDHKAKKLYSPVPILQPPVVPTSKNNKPLPLEPPLLLPDPDPEVLKHMMSFHSSAGPSPPKTPEKVKKEDRWTFLDDEESPKRVKSRGSKLVKKRRDSSSRGRKREGSVTRWGLA